MSVSLRAGIAGALVALVGAAGLARGSVAVESTSAAPGVAVVDAYVREPASADTAAAYFTVTNGTSQAVHLVRVTSGAGATTSLHTGTDMKAVDSLTVPAEGSLTLSPGVAHVMIEGLYGPLKPGQTANLELQFADADSISVAAPVIAITAPAPTAGGGR